MSPEKCDINELKIQYEEIFRAEWEKEPRREEILEIGKRNTEGGLWILGGLVYRTIIKGLYGRETRGEKGVIDVDFVAEKLASHKNFTIPPGWTLKFTQYENPYLETEGYRVSLDSLYNYRPLLLRGIPFPELRDLLERTPLNIQSIAWDCTRESLIGAKGILAIHNQRVQVNDYQDLGRAVRDLGLDPLSENLEKLVRKKAEDLGFEFDFIYPKESDSSSHFNPLKDKVLGRRRRVIKEKNHSNRT